MFGDGSNEYNTSFLNRRDISTMHSLREFWYPNKYPIKEEENMSNCQSNVLDEVEKLIDNKYKVFSNCRPDWMKNPFTGKNLEIDIYLPELKLAIEVDGPQHHEYNLHFHGSKKEFDEQKN